MLNTLNVPVAGGHGEVIGVRLGLSLEPSCAEFAGITHLELRNTELMEMEMPSISFYNPSSALMALS